jgi:hypothetical protein
VSAPPEGAVESATRSNVALPLRPALFVVETVWVPFEVAVGV